MSIHRLLFTPKNSGYAMELGAYEAAYKRMQTLEDLMRIWDLIGYEKGNAGAKRVYASIFADKAFETLDVNTDRKRHKRSYFDARARYLHLATLDEMISRGYRGYVGSSGKIYVSNIVGYKEWWQRNEFTIKID